MSAVAFTAIVGSNCQYLFRNGVGYAVQLCAVEGHHGLVAFFLLRHERRILSSGQKQRVNIIRALIEMDHNPDRLFILDEITSNLDDTTREAAIKLFEDVMWDESTVIFITHNEGFDAICDNKIVVKDHRFISDNIRVSENVTTIAK